MKTFLRISIVFLFFLNTVSIYADDFFTVHIIATPNELLEEGDIITYTISVVNSGIIEPSYLTLSDAMLGGNITSHTGDVNSDGILNLTETWVYLRTYTVTADDIDTNGGGDGRINGILTAKGYNADGNLTQLTGVPHEIWIGLNPNIIPAPIGNSPQQFCEMDTTLDFNDIVVFNTEGYNDIIWYATDDNTGTPIDLNTELTAGTYYAFQGLGASALSLAVTVQSNMDILSPLGTSDYYFCDGESNTLTNVGIFNTSGFNGLYWFTDDTQTMHINPTTTIVDGSVYYAFQGIGDCAMGLQVTFHITSSIPAPSGTTSYNCTSTCTLEDISVTPNLTGASILWYANNDTTGVALSTDAVVSVGTTYYAFQGVGSCAVSLEVIIIETATNEPPIAVDDIATTTYNTEMTINVADNDTDIDGEINPSTVDLDVTTSGIQNTFTDVNANIWTVDANGNVTFIPFITFVGSTLILYTINDNDGATSNQAYLTVIVTNPTCNDVIIGGMDLCAFLVVNPSNLIGGEDCDGDGVDNFTECIEGSDPTDSCDYNPANITEPNTAGVDCDGDGVLDVTEIYSGTDPHDPCDYNVADITVPNTAGVDCDGDGVLDVTEIYNETDPHDPCSYNVADITQPNTAGVDCDGDGVTDSQENIDGTDPHDPCDYDLFSQTEANTGDWLNADCDEDGVFNQWEIYGDTDTDGLYDVFDQDDDGDGILTMDENPDPNGDGNPDDAQDTDGDNTPDYLDTDDDNDSIPTLVEAVVAKSTTSYLDTDDDGTPNYLDEDDDGDDTLTIDEDYDGDGDPTNDDVNDNGIPDYLDEEVFEVIAPVGDSPQVYCEQASSTLGDLAVFNTPGYTEIFWFADADQNTALPITTLIEDGGIYYAFQAIGANAAYLEVQTQLIPYIPAPDGEPDQYFTEGCTMHLSDAAVFNNSIYTGIYWFTDYGCSPIGDQVDPNTVINDGDVYYAVQGLNDCCPGYLEVTFHSFPPIPAPIGDADQYFNEGTGFTLGEATVFNTEDYDTIFWYTDIEKENPVDFSHVVEDGDVYYAFQAVCACECGGALYLEVTFHMIPLAVGDNEKSNFNLYPNPVKDKLLISLENEVNEFSIKLIDMQGRIVMAQQYQNTSKTSIDVAHLNKGVYLVKLMTDGKFQTFKILVE